MLSKQKLLISVRGRNEALEAAEGGADIVDVEYPGSALGTPYPLNIFSVKKAIKRFNKKQQTQIQVSTNIGEKQHVWATASQAALGVALAGCDIIKVGLAELYPEDAIKVMKRVVRNVKKWFPEKRLIATFFADWTFLEYMDPFTDGVHVGIESGSDGVLIDTYNKNIGKGLLDWTGLEKIKEFVELCHKYNLEAWIAGSVTENQLPGLWATGVNVICIRGAATEGYGRMAKVKKEVVHKLVNTIPG